MENAERAHAETARRRAADAAQRTNQLAAAGRSMGLGGNGRGTSPPSLPFVPTANHHRAFADLGRNTTSPGNRTYIFICMYVMYIFLVHVQKLLIYQMYYVFFFATNRPALATAVSADSSDGSGSGGGARGGTNGTNTSSTAGTVAARNNVGAPSATGPPASYPPTAGPGMTATITTAAAGGAGTAAAAAGTAFPGGVPLNLGPRGSTPAIQRAQTFMAAGGIGDPITYPATTTGTRSRARNPDQVDVIHAMNQHQNQAISQLSSLASSFGRSPDEQKRASLEASIEGALNRMQQMNANGIDTTRIRARITALEEALDKLQDRMFGL